MPKTLRNRILISIKKRLLRRKGVLIHNNTVFSNVSFLGEAEIEPYCRLTGTPLITVGNNFYLNAGCHLLGEIVFGNDVMIGPKTVIWGRDHGVKKDELMRNQQHQYGKISIGDDVWIGANCTILKGISIGNGVVIGAGSVVVKDIPENAICVGNPARVVKYRS